MKYHIVGRPTMGKLTRRKEIWSGPSNPSCVRGKLLQAPQFNSSLSRTHGGLQSIPLCCEQIDALHGLLGYIFFFRMPWHKHKKSFHRRFGLFCHSAVEHTITKSGHFCTTFPAHYVHWWWWLWGSVIPRFIFNFRQRLVAIHWTLNTFSGPNMVLLVVGKARVACMQLVHS